MVLEKKKITRQEFDDNSVHLRMWVLKTCRRIMRDQSLVEDATQNAMLLAWKRFDQFDGVSSINTWLHSIATNACYDMLLKMRCRPEGKLDDFLTSNGDPRSSIVEFLLDPAASPLEAVSRSEILKYLDDAMAGIPGWHRIAFTMYHVEGYSLPEVTKALNQNENTVKVALFRMRQRAKRILLRRGFTERDISSLFPK